MTRENPFRQLAPASDTILSPVRAQPSAALPGSPWLALAFMCLLVGLASLLRFATWQTLTAQASETMVGAAGQGQTALLVCVALLCVIAAGRGLGLAVLLAVMPLGGAIALRFRRPRPRP